jgi:hypothetical protein
MVSVVRLANDLCPFYDRFGCGRFGLACHYDSGFGVCFINGFCTIGANQGCSYMDDINSIYPRRLLQVVCTLGVSMLVS